MATLEFLDENLFLRFRRDIQFYYFGNGCIADYKMNSIAYLDMFDIKIISCINGELTIKDIIERVIALNQNVIYEEVKNRISNMICNNIILARKEKKKSLLVVYGKPGKFYPKKLQIELTSICNFNCPFCYKDARSEGRYISDNIIYAIDKIIKGNINNILLTGGEPTLHPNLLNYIELFSCYSNVRMVTNGSKLYKMDSDVLKKLDLIQFSLYGNNNDEYKMMTGVSDGFTQLMKSIEFVKNENISYSIAVTLSYNTIENAEKFIETAFKLGAGFIDIGVADPFGREISSYSKDVTYMQKVETSLSKIIELKRKYLNKINVRVNNIDVPTDSNPQINNKIYDRCLKCGCGIEEFTISQDGKLRACECFPESVFDMGGLEALSAFIEGDLQKEKLHKSVITYFQQKRDMNFEMFPCIALEEYCKKYM